MTTPFTQKQNKTEFTKQDNNDVEQTPCLNWIERSVLISLLISKAGFFDQSIPVLKAALS